ncbi:MAG: OmpA family protein [Planctomycetes bacterium]|nr:OmpA family protein [Planctomycetota bacterium]
MAASRCVRAIAVGGCVVALLSGCTVASMQRKLDRAEERIQTLQRDRDKLENRLLVATGEQRAIEQSYKELQVRAADLQSRLRAAQPATADSGLAAPTPAIAPGESGFEGLEGVQVSQGIGGDLHVTLEQRVLFASGSASVKSDGMKVLAAISSVLKEKYPKRLIRVEGHTDNEPVKRVKDQFPTNWELSGARACAVLRALVEANAVEPASCSAVAHGAERPVQPNDTKEGRGANRRVEIVILP